MNKTFAAACAVIFLLFLNIIVMDSRDGEAAPAFFLRESASAAARQELLSRFRTGYNTENLPRSNNVALAAAAINGLVLSPEREYSFNEITGERTEDRGYRYAKVIYDGRYVEGLGGGVCQVSTTLYNALLLAGVEIAEVHAHTLRPDYVKPSMDAMVSYGQFDLKFVNRSGSPVIVYASARGGDLTVDVYGDNSGFKAKYVSIITEEIPPESTEIIYDEEGLYADKVIFKQESFVLVREKAGVRSCLYMETEKNGTVVSEKIREDCYMPLRGRVVFGTL